MTTKLPPHPIQPTYPDEDGTLRFRENKVVNCLLEEARKHGVDLNFLAMQDLPREDWVQFAQLIGYSVGSFGTISYVTSDDYALVTAPRPNGESDLQARVEILTERLTALKNMLREPIAELYDIHPDDLGAAD